MLTDKTWVLHHLLFGLLNSCLDPPSQCCQYYIFSQHQVSICHVHSYNFFVSWGTVLLLFLFYICVPEFFSWPQCRCWLSVNQLFRSAYLCYTLLFLFPEVSAAPLLFAPLLFAPLLCEISKVDVSKRKIREKKSGNFVKIWSGKPGKVREFFFKKSCLPWQYLFSFWMHKVFHVKSFCSIFPIKTDLLFIECM